LQLARDGKEPLAGREPSAGIVGIPRGLEGMQSMERSPPQNMADWKGAFGWNSFNPKEIGRW